jgi:hypothetical protein
MTDPRCARDGGGSPRPRHGGGHPSRVTPRWPPGRVNDDVSRRPHVAPDLRDARGVGSLETRATATTCSDHCLCMELLAGHILGLFHQL